MSGVGKQFEQLPMFMSAHEIRGQYQASDRERIENEDGDLESDNEFYSRKYDEANFDWGDGQGTHADHILRHGVSEPIALEYSPTGGRRRPQVIDGHHRIAVMHEERPHDLMPVEHHR